MSLVVAILGLAFLILIHEAGHFFTALAVGMRPRSFNIGFGPPLAKVTRNGIDYAIRAIPLGGYVKIPGMHRPAGSDVDSYFGRTLRDAPQLVGPAERLKRALDAEDLEDADIRLRELDRAAERSKIEGTERGVQEVGDALSPDAYWRQSTWKRVVTIAAGPATNLVFAMLMFAVYFMVTGGKPTTTVDEVLPGRTAAAIGLRPGDRILSINGQPVTASEVTQRVYSSKGRPLTILVLRGVATQTLGPGRARHDNDGVYRLGFRLQAEHLAAGASFLQSLKLTGTVARETVKSLANLVHKQGRDQISSPVGIVKASSSAAKQGWEQYLGVLGFISLSLALLNLLPLLPLDGGHIAFSLIEGVRGRAVSRAIYERVSAVGIALVLLLFFVGLTNDVGRLGGG